MQQAAIGFCAIAGVLAGDLIGDGSGEAMEKKLFVEIKIMKINQQKNASTPHEHTRQYFILKPTNTDTIEYEATFFSSKQIINSNRRMDWNCYNNSPYLCILQQHRDRHAKMVIIPVSAEIKFNGMQDQLMSIRFHSLPLVDRGWADPFPNSKCIGFETVRADCI